MMEVNTVMKPVPFRTGLEIPGELKVVLQNITLVEIPAEQQRVILPSSCHVIVIPSGRSARLSLSGVGMFKAKTFENAFVIPPHEQCLFLQSAKDIELLIAVFRPGTFNAFVPELSVECVANAPVPFPLTSMSGAVEPGMKTYLQVDLLLQDIHHRVTKNDLVETDNQRMFRKIFAFMLNADDTVNIRSMCDALQISYKKAERIFIRHLGLTPKSFLRIKRFMTATTLLLSEGYAYDCKSVAQRCGYHDLPHMIKEIKSVFGVTPANLARTFRQDNILYIEHFWTENAA